jgi:hypothetical protein
VFGDNIDRQSCSILSQNRFHAFLESKYGFSIRLKDLRTTIWDYSIASSGNDSAGGDCCMRIDSEGSLIVSYAVTHKNSTMRLLTSNYI